MSLRRARSGQVGWGLKTGGWKRSGESVAAEPKGKLEEQGWE